VTRESVLGRVELRWAQLLAASLAVLLVHRAMDTTSKVGQGEMFVPRPEQARLTALGFDAVLSDYYWLQAVQVVGGDPEGATRWGRLIGRLIDVVTALDPWVGHPSRFAAVWMADSVDSVLHANALLKRAIAYHPRDWRNYHYLGFNDFFYLGDDAAAADALEHAVGLPDAPPYLASLVAKLREQRQGLDTAATFLEELARNTDDEYARAEYLKSLDEVETERRARFLDGARAEYRRRNGHDITSVADLVRGPGRVLKALPPAHPHFPAFQWVIDPKTGQIVSSFYKERYRPHVQAEDEQRREEWRKEIQARRGA
jgi:hypothetical protein